MHKEQIKINSFLFSLLLINKQQTQPQAKQVKRERWGGEWQRVQRLLDEINQNMTLITC